MTARYANGSGQPPRHVCEIRHEGRGATVVLRGADGGVVLDVCGDDAALRARIGALIAQRVPFVVGGMAPGPADVVAALVPDGAWLELSWRRPGEWSVREVGGGVTEWREVDVGELLLGVGSA